MASDNKGPRSDFVRVNGVRLHYLEWGDPSKADVVLLHGLSSTCHNWDSLCESLSTDYHLYAVDQRGHGDSDKPESGYHPSDYAADLAAFREAMGLENIFLVGHSMGGRVSLVHTVQSGRAVKALVMVDVGPDIRREGLARVTSVLSKAPPIFADEQEAYEHIKRLRPRYSHATVQSRVLHSLRRLEDGRLTWKYDQAALLQTINARPKVDWWDLLGKLHAPTMVVRGGQSDVLHSETTQKMMEVIPTGHLVEIAEGSHAVPYEDTEIFEKAVRRFFADLA